MVPKLNLLFIATFCISIGLTQSINARTITHDNGGRISEFQRHFRIAVKANVRYRIKGTCLSACTIYLGLPYVCVYPDAILGFHGAWPRLFDPAQQRVADRRMGQYLPPNLRRHYMNEWRHKNALSFKYLTGNEVVALEPKIKLCQDT
jgi:hypothetical protein